MDYEKRPEVKKNIVSLFDRRPSARTIFAAIVVTTLIVCAFAPASASGRRGTVLTTEKIKTFTELKANASTTMRLNYVGSTPKWHIFMNVKTSTGGGMPFDHLFIYKVAAAQLAVQNGWQIVFSKRVINAANCPVGKARKGQAASLIVPAGPQVRRHCGT